MPTLKAAFALVRIQSACLGDIMQHHYKTLKFAPVDPASTCVKADRGYTDVTLNHPALAVMTDFRHAPAFGIGEGMPVGTALEKMKTVGVRMLMVTDSDQLIHGIVTADDILGERALTALERTRVKRDELTVAEVMHPSHALYAFRMNDILNATVGDLLATLRSYGFQHVLVTTLENGQPKIRGLFSAAEIARHLHQDFDPLVRAQSFAELGRTLLGSVKQAA
ncbi:CBS domain containing-hemolysin-like protein [Chitinivorax tropicus]|uniref:CBS domain containing-hemolysin-like protein n=1 Tax=Chitinivorax tropicus TaxID=714531 RepID=A0A840MLI4_9PROT|nr:CBS domain-containing protein [Chitinivorax tropicus]MBB5019270.1 CBS domain containing-hemolysin-like protein [Chitinivorax tropicus]